MDNTAVIEGLLAYGGDPSAVAFNGLSVLALAEQYGNADIAESLRSHGARYAASQEERNMLPELKKAVQYKAELYKAWDKAGRTPAALPQAARHAAKVVWLGIDEADLQILEQQATPARIRKQRKQVDLPLGLAPRLQYQGQRVVVWSEGGVSLLDILKLEHGFSLP